MKRLVFTIAALGLSTSVFAQNAPLVLGVVQKIDEAQGKVTLQHGPIKNLDMDGMTMVFRAQDPAMLKEIKVGDKVQFTADRVNGQITVTSLKKGQ
ncbi:copper-binding protein [Microvirga terricola]|uniref:Copper-binding protein n=1 Tax=Microvirga terricola TaxID=2719797 RepID=A0ABX0VHT5_9HYPH|nr:copper-binding protein [Microvirga terricola]NIX78256.1 copper-binding protein [Microvirga terricola]